MASLIGKAFKCIEALARSPDGLTVSAAATVTGLSRPATDRLLDGLTVEGIVFRDAKTKRYRLGSRLYQWANTAIQAATPVNLARREIINLSLETGNECNFLVLIDLETVLVERCDVVEGVPVNRSVQTPPRLWFKTGTGKVIVAFSSPEARQRILERTFKLPGLQPPPREDLEAELEEAQARRFVATPDSRNPAARTGIVVPIFDMSCYAVAAVGSYIEAADLENEAGMALILKMTVTAARISHYLGFEEQRLDSLV